MRAPEFYIDPGNVNLDLTFYLLCMWDFMTPSSLPEILTLSWKDYGARGERSSEGPMNFRGNVLEALLGYCYDQSVKVSGGYHAAIRSKQSEASSSSRKPFRPWDQEPTGASSSSQQTFRASKKTFRPRGKE